MILIVKVQPRGILTRLEIDQMIERLNSVRDKALIVMLYIFGFRISEIIALRKGHEVCIYSENGTTIMKITHKPLKKRHKGGIIDSRDIYLDMSKLIYNDLIMGYYGLVVDGDLLFPFTRVRAWQIIKKANPECWCHLFRHTRATMLAEEDTPVYSLMQWFDWSDSNMAMRYIQKKPIKNIENKIR